MTAKTIEGIRELLMQKSETATEEYKKIEKALRTKYKTRVIKSISLLEDEELEKYLSAKEQKEYFKTMLDDFEQYDFK